MNKLFTPTKRLIKNRKGSIQDLILSIGIILFFAMMILISFKVTSEFNTNVAANADIPARAKTSTSTLTGFFPGVIDNVFLIFALGLGVVAIALASLVRVHPVFIIFFFIALVFVILISGVASNIYDEMASNTQLSTEANQLTMVSHIMTYLPFIIGVLGIILMTVMYKTWSNNQDVF